MKTKKSTDNDQIKGTVFRKAARELGCDESEERFQEKLRVVAKAKPKPVARDHNNKQKR